MQELQLQEWTSECFVWLSICLLICLSACLSVRLFYMSVNLSVSQIYKNDKKISSNDKCRNCHCKNGQVSVLFVFMSSVCPSIFMSICPSVFMSICPSVFMSICLLVSLSFLSSCLFVSFSWLLCELSSRKKCVNVCLHVCLFVCLSICMPFLCVSIFLSIYLSLKSLKTTKKFLRAINARTATARMDKWVFCLTIYLSTYMSVCLFVCLSFLYECQSVCLSSL